MSTKTPEQIAQDVYWTISEFPSEPRGADLRRIMVAAIKADRAQRGIIELGAEVLDDRDSSDAAQLARDTDPDDDLWNNYVGPMIDSIEEDYTKLATEAS